mmetsp:Transcript_8253/g.10098  ORF Transcript_8253/g.10098 Transcript_8253/m.10098 type:complete len:322 (-) Transcript_8253:32-997(-)
MVLITNKQQDLIDEVIANHLKNYDKIAQQYLKIRQDIFELTTSITHEITKEKLVSDSNKFKIQQLQYDFDKVCEIYKIHLENINLNLDIKQNIPPMYIEELNLQYDALLARKTDLESEIDTLKNMQKPLLDKMRLLLKSFQNGLNSRTAKRMNRVVSEGINEPDENSKDVDIQSLIFHSSDMKALFNDVDNKLNQLKNLSDGNTNNEDDPNSVIDTNQPKNITRYIDEHLRNGRTFHLLEEDKYIYDVSKSATVDTATSLTSVHEYDKMIENLIINIKDVIEHGAESKERWSNNARKLDIIKETLSKFEDSMDISDDEMES